MREKEQSSVKVSVIMGIYNCERTLSAAIDSILSQTYSNVELILCDDGSTDRTYGIASQYAKRNPEKIVLLKNEKNLRLAATLNNCLAHATGKYIARMDADDISLPERLEREVFFLEDHPDIDCVGTGRIIFDDDGEYGARIDEEYPTKEILLKRTPFVHPTIMMKASVFKALGGYTVAKETMRAEDLDLWFRFFANGYKGYVIQEALYKYRESLLDFKKRTLKAAVGTSKVYLKGYKLLGFSKIKSVYALKPIISALLPKKFMFKYHRKKCKK